MLGPDQERTPGFAANVEQPKEDFQCSLTLKQIQRELRKLTKTAKEGADVDEARFDFLLKAQEHNLEYQRILAEERENWRESVEEFAEQCLQRTRTFIPVNIFESSEDSLRQLGLSPELTRRILQRQCLWLVRMSKEEISRIHESDVLGRFNSLAQGMDIIETAAIYASLPDSFANDYTKRKHDWKNNVEDNLRQLLLDNDNDVLPEDRIRNPAYEGLQFGPVEDVESVRMYSFVSGKHSHVPRRSFIELCQKSSIVSKLKSDDEGDEEEEDSSDSEEEDESDDDYEDSEVHEGDSVIVVDDSLSNLGTPFRSKKHSTDSAHKASPHLNGSAISADSADSSFAIVEGADGEEDDEDGDEEEEDSSEEEEDEDGVDEDSTQQEKMEGAGISENAATENGERNDMQTVGDDTETPPDATVADTPDAVAEVLEEGDTTAAAIEEGNDDGDDDDSGGEDWEDPDVVPGRASASSDWTEDRGEDDAVEVEDDAGDAIVLMNSEEQAAVEKDLDEDDNADDGDDAMVAASASADDAVDDADVGNADLDGVEVDVDVTGGDDAANTEDIETVAEDDATPSMTTAQVSNDEGTESAMGNDEEDSARPAAAADPTDASDEPSPEMQL